VQFVFGNIGARLLTGRADYTKESWNLCAAALTQAPRQGGLIHLYIFAVLTSLKQIDPNTTEFDNYRAFFWLCLSKKGFPTFLRCFHAL